MIVLCERLPSGEIKRHNYPDKVPGLDAIAEQAFMLDRALDIGWQILQDRRHPCWIERVEQPASQPTIDRRDRNLMLNPFLPGGKAN